MPRVPRLWKGRERECKFRQIAPTVLATTGRDAGERRATWMATRDGQRATQTAVTHTVTATIIPIAQAFPTVPTPSGHALTATITPIEPTRMDATVAARAIPPHNTPTVAQSAHMERARPPREEDEPGTQQEPRQKNGPRVQHIGDIGINFQNSRGIADIAVAEEYIPHRLMRGNTRIGGSCEVNWDATLLEHIRKVMRKDHLLNVYGAPGPPGRTGVRGCGCALITRWAGDGLSSDGQLYPTKDEKSSGKLLIVAHTEPEMSAYYVVAHLPHKDGELREFIDWMSGAITEVVEQHHRKYPGERREIITMADWNFVENIATDCTGDTSGKSMPQAVAALRRMRAQLGTLTQGPSRDAYRTLHPNGRATTHAFHGVGPNRSRYDRFEITEGLWIGIGGTTVIEHNILNRMDMSVPYISHQESKKAHPEIQPKGSDHHGISLIIRTSSITKPPTRFHMRLESIHGKENRREHVEIIETCRSFYTGISNNTEPTFHPHPPPQEQTTPKEEKAVACISGILADITHSTDTKQKAIKKNDWDARKKK